MPFNPLKRFSRFTFTVAVLGLFLAFGLPVVIAYGAAALFQLPNELPLSPQSSTIYSSDNTIIGQLTSAQNRKDLKSSEIPDVMKAAIVASEDKGFYTESGISYPGMYRAELNLAKSLVHGGGSLSGGSTIEQQYVKNALLTPEKSYTRKLKDIGLGQNLAKTYSKDEILALYLNTIFYGRNAYGLDAASRAYFGHSGKRLSLKEAATLAALVQQPENYNKPEFKDRLILRRDVHVIGTMVTTGKLDPLMAKKVIGKPVGFIPFDPVRATSVDRDRYVIALVRQYVTATLGPKAVAQGGLKIYTTINWNLQQAAQRAIVRNKPAAGVVGSMVAITPSTGAVVSLVNSTSFQERQFNIAVQARRPVGSTMKTFVLADAINKGVSINTVLPAPAYALIDGVKVNSDDFKQHEYLDMAHALATSNNPWFMELINGTQARPDAPDEVFPIDNDPIRPQSVADLAHETGIDDTLNGQDPLFGGDSEAPKLDAVPSLALGTSSMSPLQLTSGYGTFANGGKHATTYFVDRIKDRTGKVLYQHETQTSDVMEADASRRLTKVMQGVISPEGTAHRAYFGRPAAGKTGTTDTDAWFSGYTANDIVSSAWYGYLDNRKLTVDGKQVFGGTSAALAWRDFMVVASQGKTVRQFQEPDSPGDIILGDPVPTPSATVTPTDTPTTELPTPTDTLLPTETTQPPTATETTDPPPPLTEAPAPDQTPPSVTTTIVDGGTAPGPVQTPTPQAPAESNPAPAPTEATTPVVTRTISD